MIITYHREKLLNAIIYMANNTMFCGKTKLLKLLYFLDFKHFKQTAKSVTGLDYYAWEKGPVPKKLFEELSGNMKPDNFHPDNSEVDKARAVLDGYQALKTRALRIVGK